jgi:dTDP-4-amino-4,6-dideoxygalactose transaminase
VDSLEQIAREHGVPLIFDAAHAFGASKGVAPIGGQGRASVFSMSPTKLVVAGEGGLVATNDDDLAQRIRMGRDYGMSKGYDSLFPGLNARLPEFNALMALKSLAMLEDAVNRRNEVADLYRSRLLALDGISFQEVLSGDRSSYKDFTIFIDENRFNISRDGLAQALRERNIDSRAYYDPPVHQQQAYRQYHNGEDLRWTDAAAKEAISLPIWSDMDPGIVERICDQIISIHKSKE